MPAKRRITAEDLYRFHLVKDLRISPDGKHVVYVVERVDRKTEKKHTNLWLVSTRGGAPKPFTTGDHRDFMPRWSPDGRTLAFLSNREDEKQPQIYLIDLDGGEARRLTDFRGEVGEMVWSPDGTRLLIQFRKKDPEIVAMEKDPKKRERGLVERHITRMFYKLDGYGFLPKDRWHLYLVDVRTGKMTQLTDGPYDETGPTFTPDGKWIVFVSNRSEDPERDPDAVDLWRIPATGGDMERIPTPYGPKHAPSVSPDGRFIAYYGHEGKNEWWRNQSLWVVPWEGGEAQNLTQAHDLHTAVDIINDVIGAWATPRPLWSPDGETLYFPVALHGKVQVRRIRRDGSAMETLIDEPAAVGFFDLDRAGQRLAYFMGTLTDPGQVYVLDLRRRRSRQLTRLNPWLRRVDLGTVEEVWFTGKDGYRLQGWIVKPPDFDPAKQYPAIMEIHGGPQTQYGFAFMHEFYYLAAQGFVVGFSNPRGGRGYGEEHTRAIWGRWGTYDYEDLMAWADYLEQLPYIDPKRMGVTGGSYGGYMTLWIIGHTNRFRAAVAQRVVSNFISMWGTSDFNWVFQNPLQAGPPWEDLQKYWERSPIAYLGNAETPTLIIHSEQDHRTPIEQGEQAYIALKYKGVPTAFVRFPGEPHGLSRVGRTDRRIARLNHILRWFQTYLKEGNSALDKEPTPFREEVRDGYK